jgi:hypothetical protein
MRERKDIVLIDGDIYIAPTVNDLPLQPSDAQSIGNIINAAPGWYKDTPSLGVNILAYLNAPNKIQKLNAMIRLMLSSDGYNSNPVSVFSNGSLFSVTANANLI